MPGLLCGVKRGQHDRLAGSAKSGLRITINSALNIDFKELGDYLGDPVITAATVDRMIHHSIIITIEGPSWRLHESQQLNARK
jgi:hypothetical protein